LRGKIAFLMDSQTVVNLRAGSKGQLERLRAQVKLLLARHRDWTLMLVEGDRNKAADHLSRRAFRPTDKLGSPDSARTRLGRRGPRMPKSPSGFSPDPELDIRPSAEPKYSRSLEFGLAIVGCFTVEEQVLGIAELADKVKVSRSTTHRYAMTLATLGHLEQDDKRRYRLARGITGAGATFVDTLRLETPAARTILEDLREQTGHTVSMGVLDGTRVLYIHRLFAHGQGQYEADLGLGAGAFVPAYCAAIGKPLLASLSDPDRREAMAALKLKSLGPNTITRKGVLAGELLAIHVAGIAVCDEEQARGVRSIAATITQPGRSRLMAVSVTVPSRSMSVERMTTELGPRVLAAAERI
jgi:DNA-binding IclR family transcriptional regulator